MRLLICLSLLLSGCTGAEVLLGVTAGAIPVFHRTPMDMAASAATGLDCSIVHLDRNERYCHDREPPPEPPVFCTRSLGVADCWADPRHLPNTPRELADGPRTLTPPQEADRARWWPGLWPTTW